MHPFRFVPKLSGAFRAVIVAIKQKMGGALLLPELDQRRI
jgi:hypothetical protein